MVVIVVTLADMPKVMKIMVMPLLLDKTPICMAAILRGMQVTNLLSSNSK